MKALKEKQPWPFLKYSSLGIQRSNTKDTEKQLLLAFGLRGTQTFYNIWFQDTVTYGPTEFDINFQLSNGNKTICIWQKPHFEWELWSLLKLQISSRSLWQHWAAQPATAPYHPGNQEDTGTPAVRGMAKGWCLGGQEYWFISDSWDFQFTMGWWGHNPTPNHEAFVDENWSRVSSNLCQKRAKRA